MFTAHNITNGRFYINEIKQNLELKYLGGYSEYSAYLGWIEILEITMIGLFILSLSLFFPRSGRFTRFIHKLSFEYIIFILIITSFEVLMRTTHFLGLSGQRFPIEYRPTIESVLIHANVLNAGYVFTQFFYIISLITIAILFYGLADRFFIGNSYDVEFTLLVYLIYIGSLVLFIAQNLIEFVLALEVISLGSYALAAYERKNKMSAYSGIQYFIIGSLPSGVLFLSLALMYKAWGTLGIPDIDSLLSNMALEHSPIAKQIYQNTIVEELIQNNYKAQEEALQAKLFFEKYTTLDEWTLGKENAFWTTRYPVWGYNWNTDTHFELGFYQDGLWVLSHNLGLEKNPLPESLIGAPLTNNIGWAEKLCIMQYNDQSFSSAEDIQKFWNIVPTALNLENTTEFWTWDLTTHEKSMLLALLLIMFNLLFKITAAPFNFWAPVIYGSAPSAAVTFLSIYSKVAVFCAMFKLICTIFSSFYFVITAFLLFCGTLSILFGMAGAFTERVTKRFFVYSSMGHVGFMLVAFAAATPSAYAAILHYLFIYMISSFLMWFVFLLMGKARMNIIQFGKLKFSSRWLAYIFGFLIFSLSGIPPLAGFYVKLEVLLALIMSSNLFVNFLLLFFSVFAFFYYLRIIKIMFFDKTREVLRNMTLNDERLWLVSVLFLALLFYMFIIHKSLLEVECGLIEPLTK